MDAAATNIPAASKVLMASFQSAASGVDQTILRVVGHVGIATDNRSSAEAQIGSIGMMIVTDIAAAAGIASIPGPFTDAGDDWLMFQSWSQEFHVATSVGFDPLMMVRHEFDSKSKRVLDGTGKRLVVVIENGHASAAFDAVVHMRILTQARGTG